MMKISLLKYFVVLILAICHVIGAVSIGIAIEAINPRRLETELVKSHLILNHHIYVVDSASLTCFDMYGSTKWRSKMQLDNDIAMDALTDDSFILYQMDERSYVEAREEHRSDALKFSSAFVYSTKGEMINELNVPMICTNVIPVSKNIIVYGSAFVGLVFINIDTEESINICDIENYFPATNLFLHQNNIIFGVQKAESSNIDEICSFNISTGNTSIIKIVYDNMYQAINLVNPTRCKGLSYYKDFYRIKNQIIKTTNNSYIISTPTYYVMLVDEIGKVRWFISGKAPWSNSINIVDDIYVVDLDARLWRVENEGDISYLSNSSANVEYRSGEKIITSIMDNKKILTIYSVLNSIDVEPYEMISVYNIENKIFSNYKMSINAERSCDSVEGLSKDTALLCTNESLFILEL